MIHTILDVFRTRFFDPLKEFIHDSRAIGIVLLACTAISLVIANIVGLPYLHLWETTIPFSHALHIPHSLLHFINDGLMAVFFFLAGMEIRRELMEGELASLKSSLLPVGAAIGGMAIPAIIFFAFNVGTSYLRGWAIPTATDIAFSLGVASLLGNKVPISVKIFLTALAIIDDLGAIIVIALFYGSSINLYFLGGALIVIVLLILYKRKAKRISPVTLLLGIALWYCMFNSGIHATIAGVLFAFLIPSRYLTRLEVQLHHPVYFIIMPIFALANTAIIIPSDPFGALNTSLAWGIMLGLFIGKPLGIALSSWILIRTKLVNFPTNASWVHLIGAGILAGIGFTMSIFIATLAFTAGEQDISKIAVLIASLASIFCGYFWLSRSGDYKRT